MHYIPALTCIKCDCYTCEHLFRPLLPRSSARLCGSDSERLPTGGAVADEKRVWNIKGTILNSKSIKITLRDRSTQVSSGVLFIPKYVWLHCIHQRKQSTVNASNLPSALPDLIKRLLVQSHVWEDINRTGKASHVSHLQMLVYTFKNITGNKTQWFSTNQGHNQITNYKLQTTSEESW